MRDRLLRRLQPPTWPTSCLGVAISAAGAVGNVRGVPAGPVDTAQGLAESLMATDLRKRWAHVRGVAERAAKLGSALHADRDMLVRAAWLHDIGYSARARRTGFHPLDGAHFLHDSGYPPRLCALVAHHSAAAVEARYFGCLEQLRAFPDEGTLTRDLLWYCDMTVGPRGDRLSFTERMNDVRARYGADSYVTQALDASMSERIGAVIRAETWVESVGLAGQV